MRLVFNRRWLRIVLVSALGAGLLVFVLGWFSPQILTVDSGPVTGDVLVVLGGGTTERCGRAAELFRQRVAPKILVSGEGDSQASRQALTALGVPAPAIALESESHNTFENAKLSAIMLRQMGAHRVVIVTSWYHSRRALACFRQQAPDIRFYSRPAYDGCHRPGWEWKKLGKYVGAEYLKLAGYVVRHGVWPG